MPGNRCLESRLAQAGLFGGSPNDFFDYETAVGVSLWQQSVGRPATSVPDSMTLLSMGIWRDRGPAGCSVKVRLGAPWMPGTRCLESRLAQLGLFFGTPDDLFTWDTAVAVSHYQQSVRIRATSVPDLTTLTYMGIWSGPPPATCTVPGVVGAGSPGVRCLETRLAELGLFAHAADDTFDWDTSVGISLYQQSAGLPNTATGNAATLVAMRILQDPNPVPANSGSGRRIVYSRAQQRIWLIAADGSVFNTHRVSGRTYEPYAGTYRVYSRSEYTYSANDPSVRWRYMVRFTYGPGGGRIGFHEIPNRNGRPLQTKEQLGLPLSGGCVRQSTEDALLVWNWAPIGTTVVVLYCPPRRHRHNHTASRVRRR